MSVSKRYTWSKVLLWLTASVGPLMFVQGQLFHYGQLEALGAPLSLFPIDMQQSWMLACQAYFHLVPVIGETFAEMGLWLIPGMAALSLGAMLLMVYAAKGMQRVDGPVSSWWQRRLSKDFRVLMRGWSYALAGLVGGPALIFYALVVLLFFGGFSYLAGQHSIAQHRKTHFRGFAEIEMAGPPSVGLTRLFECRGDYCLLIRADRAVVIARSQLDGRTLLGQSMH